MKLLPLFVGLSLGLGSLAADQLAKGKQLYMTCVACHGSKGEGNPVLKAPAVAGQEDWYLKSQLVKFKEGIRGAHPKDVEGMQMRPMAMTLQDEASIDAVIAYIKTFKAVKPEKTIKGGDPARGKQLYTTCGACHGAKAEGMAALKAPSLKQLPDWYIMTQLVKYRDGVRGAHPKDVEGMQMRPMAMTLQDEESMKDVIAFIHSIQKQ